MEWYEFEIRCEQYDEYCRGIDREYAEIAEYSDMTSDDSDPGM